MNKSESWEDWIDVWSGFWLEGVALPIVAAFGIIGEKFDCHKIFNVGNLIVIRYLR